MSTLTDRYVFAVTRTLPEDTRADVGRELRASIEDMIDAREGDSREAAERSAIVELGDPARLAAQYRGRPAYLIGPAFYPAYEKLLRLLLVVVPPVAAAMALFGSIVDGDSAIGVVAAAVAAAFIAAVQVGFWTTLGFAVAERQGVTWATEQPDWDPDSLPDPVARQVGRGDSIAGIMLLSVAAALLAFAFNPTITLPSGEAVLLFASDVWGWRWYFVGVLAVMVVLELVKLARGHWTWGLAWANAVVEVAFAAPAAWLLLSGRLISESTMAALGSVMETEWIPTTMRVAAAVVIIVSCWDIVDGFRKARAAGSGGP
jgi:hypothetical protein